MKRRLRSITAELGGNPGWDLVVIARKSASEAGYADLKTALKGLLRSLRILDRAKARAV